MGEAIRQDNLASRLSDLERRLRILENTSRGIRSNVQDGAFTVLDGPGNTVVTLGKIGDHYGLQIEDSFYADERGLDTPQFPMPQNFVVDAGQAYFTIQNGWSWTIASATVLPVNITHTSLRALIGYQFTGGSSGRVRIESGVKDNTGVVHPTFGVTTSPTLAGTGATAAQVDWNHHIPRSLPAAAASYYWLRIEGEVEAGPGTLLIYEPSVVLVNDSYGATDDGVWYDIAW